VEEKLEAKTEYQWDSFNSTSLNKNAVQ